MTRIAAVVFDFDGTIIDTETPIYEGWRDTFVHAGVEPIDFEVWASQIGLASDDALDTRAVLCERLGVDTMPDELETLAKRLVQELLHEQPVRNGIVEWIDAANAAGVRLAIGSSSPTHWVHGNLERVGLRDRFELLSCADPGIPGKPDPTVYREACRGLGVEPASALAIEDSRNGVRAALDAGMHCIAAPGPITAGHDFSHASLAVTSLAEVDPGDWLS